MRKEDIPLSAKDREALIRDVFDTSRAVAWVSDWREKRQDPAFTKAAPEPLRDAYYRFIEKLRPDWEAVARSYSNSRLMDMLEDVIEKGDYLGMLEWQEQNEQKEQNKSDRER